MDKYILASILFDKAKALCIIKPLYCSFCHCYYSCVMGSILAPFLIARVLFADSGISLVSG
jgi:hypothetical protein